MHPKVHQSTFWLYLYYNNISGAMYVGVPAKVNVLHRQESSFDIPKSVSFIIPSEFTKIFDGLIFSSNSFEKIKWKKLTETHASFWEKAGSIVDLYYDLQSCIIQGLLSGSKITFSNNNNELFTLEMQS